MNNSDLLLTVHATQMVSLLNQFHLDWRPQQHPLEPKLRIHVSNIYNDRNKYAEELLDKSWKHLSFIRDFVGANDEKYLEMVNSLEMTIYVLTDVAVSEASLISRSDGFTKKLNDPLVIKRKADMLESKRVINKMINGPIKISSQAFYNATEQLKRIDKLSDRFKKSWF